MITVEDNKEKWVESDPREYARNMSLLTKLSLDKLVLKKSIDQMTNFEAMLRFPTFSIESQEQPFLHFFEQGSFASTTLLPLHIAEQWQTDLEREVQKIVFKYDNNDFRHLVKKTSKGKRAQKLNRILVVQKQIRIVAETLKEKFDFHLVSNIRMLAREMHALITFYYSKQKKYLHLLRLSQLNFLNTIVRDLRTQFRRTVRSMFKYFSDFSGSEEKDEKIITLSGTTRSVLLFFPLQNPNNEQFRYGSINRWN